MWRSNSSGVYGVIVSTPLSPSLPHRLDETDASCVAVALMGRRKESSFVPCEGCLFVESRRGVVMSLLCFRLEELPVFFYCLLVIVTSSTREEYHVQRVSLFFYSSILLSLLGTEAPPYRVVAFHAPRGGLRQVRLGFTPEHRPHPAVAFYFELKSPFKKKEKREKREGWHFVGRVTSLQFGALTIMIFFY